MAIIEPIKETTETTIKRAYLDRADVVCEVATTAQVTTLVHRIPHNETTVSRFAAMETSL